MGAPDLIVGLRNAGYSIKADKGYLDISPANNLPSDLLQQLKQHKPEILAVLRLEQQQEVRREKVVGMLESDPELRRAFYADAESDPENVILTVAIRHIATCEMLIPKANYDPWQLLALVDKAGVDHVH
ncbi:MAG: hypothetical protein ABJA60_06105 [Nitrosospira sp.]